MDFSEYILFLGVVALMWVSRNLLSQLVRNSKEREKGLIYFNLVLILFYYTAGFLWNGKEGVFSFLMGHGLILMFWLILILINIVFNVSVFLPQDIKLFIKELKTKRKNTL